MTMTKCTRVLGVSPNLTVMFMIKDWQLHCILYVGCYTMSALLRYRNYIFFNATDGFGEITCFNIVKMPLNKLQLLDSYFMHLLHALNSRQKY